jgi:hypothetical protein
LSAAAFNAIPAIAMGMPPIAADKNAAAVKNTPTAGWKNGELKLAINQAAMGSNRVTIHAAVRRRAVGEEGKSGSPFKNVMQRDLSASPSIARNLHKIAESLVVVHRDSIKVVPISGCVLPDFCRKIAANKIIRDN